MVGDGVLSVELFASSSMVVVVLIVIEEGDEGRHDVSTTTTRHQHPGREWRSKCHYLAMQ